MSCQVSNVTLVQVCWERLYSSVEALMVEPFPVLTKFTLEPPRKPPQVVYEFPVQVLDTPLNLALVLRIRRMSKKHSNAMPSTPPLPVFLELLAMIRVSALAYASAAPAEPSRPSWLDHDQTV